MQYLDGPWAQTSQAAIMGFALAHGVGLPAAVASELTAYRPSPVDRLVYACEALYANLAALDADGQVLCAQLAQVAQENGFHTLGATARAAGVIAAVRRTLGELTDLEAPPANDPEPLPEYVAA